MMRKIYLFQKKKIYHISIYNTRHNAYLACRRAYGTAVVLFDNFFSNNTRWINAFCMRVLIRLRPVPCNYYTPSNTDRTQNDKKPRLHGAFWWLLPLVRRFLPLEPVFNKIQLFDYVVGRIRCNRRAHRPGREREKKGGGEEEEGKGEEQQERDGNRHLTEKERNGEKECRGHKRVR